MRRLFPAYVDNAYRGHVAAVWLFGAVVFVRSLQSVLIIVNAYDTVSGADGIPLSTYPAVVA